jgi:hypothetical protein
MSLFGLLSLVCLLQSLYVNFFHLKHCLHNSLCSLRISVIKHLDQNSGNDLPRHPIFVFQPATLYFFSAREDMKRSFINEL